MYFIVLFFSLKPKPNCSCKVQGATEECLHKLFGSDGSASGEGSGTPAQKVTNSQAIPRALVSNSASLVSSCSVGSKHLAEHISTPTAQQTKTLATTTAITSGCSALGQEALETGHDCLALGQGALVSSRDTANAQVTPKDLAENSAQLEELQSVLDWPAICLQTPASKSAPSFTDSYIYKNYSLAKVVDSGSFGTVYKAHREGQVPCALKVTTFPHLEGQVGLETSPQEVHMLLHAAGPHVIEVLDFFLGPLFSAILMDLADTTLYDFAKTHTNASVKKINNYQNWILPLALGQKICNAMITAFAHLESRGIVHGDMHAKNVLIWGNADKVRVSDFGRARLCDPEKIEQAVSWAHYPAHVRAPELLFAKRTATQLQSTCFCLCLALLNNFGSHFGHLGK